MNTTCDFEKFEFVACSTRISPQLLNRDPFRSKIISIHKPNPENVASAPRSSDGAISARYIPRTAVVTPDESPTIKRPISNSSIRDTM